MSGDQYEPCTQFYSAWLSAYQEWETAFKEAHDLLMDMERDFNDMADSCVDIAGNPLKTFPCILRLATFLTDLKRAQSAAARVKELKDRADELATQLWSCIGAHQNSRAILPPEPDEADEIEEPALEFPPLDLTQ
jgi:hypothetical protein